MRRKEQTAIFSVKIHCPPKTRHDCGSLIKKFDLFWQIVLIELVGYSHDPSLEELTLISTGTITFCGPERTVFGQIWGP
jgi:hypothetical protein